MKLLRNTSLVVLCLTAALGARATFAATELAKVNGSVITLEDFNRKYRENLKFYQNKAPNKKAVLDDLIKRELAIQEAKKAGLDRDPEVIDQMNTVLYHALLQKKLARDFEGIHVSDGEAKDYYNKNPEVRTSHIFVAVRPDMSAADKAKAYEKIKKIYEEQIRPGKKSFAEVAQNYSEGAAAPMGGDMDYQTRDKLDPRYYEAAVALRSPGKISSIVESQYGYHIIRLTALRSWEDVDKALIKRLVFEDRRTQIFDKFMTGLRGQAKVDVKADLIKD